MFMRIAIPLTENNGKGSQVSAHFGQAAYWAIYDSDSDELEIKPNSAQHGGGGCKAVIEVASMQPDVIYTLGMGYNAIAKCEAQGIVVRSGDATTVEEVISSLDDMTELAGGCSGGQGDCH